MIEGTTVNLRRLQPHDLPTIYEWKQDIEMMKPFDDLPIHSSYDLENEFYEKFDSFDPIHLIIESSDGESIGIINLNAIDLPNRNAELQIMIGKRHMIYSASSIEAELLILDYAYNRLEMHRIYSRVVEYSSESERLLKEAGFRKEGIFRKYYFQNGRYWDVYLYGLLKSEFQVSPEISKAKKCHNP